MKKCSSCNTNIVNDTLSTTFKCPNCGEELIIRCSKCRRLGTKYTCTKCNFEGP